jgi:hypothetical protein
VEKAQRRLGSQERSLKTHCGELLSPSSSMDVVIRCRGECGVAKIRAKRFWNEMRSVPRAIAPRNRLRPVLARDPACARSVKSVADVTGSDDELTLRSHTSHLTPYYTDTLRRAMLATQLLEIATFAASSCLGRECMRPGRSCPHWSGSCSRSRSIVTN